MSLSDKLSSAKTSSVTKLCKIGNLLVLSDLSEKDKQNLKEVLETQPSNSSFISNSALGRILREEGYDISNSAVDRHRRGDCPCNRVGK
jgi:hypothetical protein